jgi:hypothetical protein
VPQFNVTGSQIRRENDEEVKLMCYGRDFQVGEGKKKKKKQRESQPSTESISRAPSG